MDTSDQSSAGSPESTTPGEIAELGVDVQVMYQRVRRHLGLGSEEEPTIGRYRVKAKLGEGGMGVVYRAYDPKLEREVAIKIVTARPLVNAEKLRARLLREAQLLAKLRHANVVTVHDTGEHAGEVFLAMEYVAGQSLREWQKAGRTRDELLRRYVEAGRGLAAAHEQGIVHRDFKPDNVLVDADGHALVGDFGLANVLTEGPLALGEGRPAGGASPARVTVIGEVVGTIGYMAPEQLSGDEVDARTDQYAYCVSLWEALVGARPFEAESSDELLAQMRGAEPRGGERLPTWLRRTLKIGLAPAPEARHASMAELVAALERGLGRRDRWRIGAVLGVAGLVGVAGVYSLVVNRAVDEVLECPLADEIVELRKGWDELEEFEGRLDDDATWARLEAELGQLEDQAREACAREGEGLAELQQFEQWFGQLRFIAETELSQQLTRESVAELERARFDAPPPKPLSEEVYGLTTALDKLEALDQLEELIAAAEPALHEPAQPLSDGDRVALGIRLGRAYLWHGDYEEAFAVLRDVRDLAETNTYRDANIRANLLLAKTAIMRTEDLELGREYLRIVDSLFGAGEPWLSRRRTEYFELLAHTKRDVPELAVWIQRFVVLRHILTGTLFERTTALINLGYYEEFRERPDLAERHYRDALELVPDDAEAALNYARTLVNRKSSAAEHEEARGLLELVLASQREDLWILAATVDLQLELELDGRTAAIEERRDALVELLETNDKALPEHREQAWAHVALAHAALGDIGPDYDAAFAQIGDGPDTAEQRVDVLREGAELARAEHPEVARELENRARAELEREPDPDSSQ